MNDLPRLDVSELVSILTPQRESGATVSPQHIELILENYRQFEQLVVHIESLLKTRDHDLANATHAGYLRGFLTAHKVQQVQE